MSVSPTTSFGAADASRETGSAHYIPYVGEDLTRSRAYVNDARRPPARCLGSLPRPCCAHFPRFAPHLHAAGGQCHAHRTRPARHGRQAAGKRGHSHADQSGAGGDAVWRGALRRGCGSHQRALSFGELAYVIENADLVTLLTTDAIAEQVNFVERLNAALPTLAASPDAERLQLAASPKLRNVVLFGVPQPGFVTQAALRGGCGRRAGDRRAPLPGQPCVCATRRSSSTPPAPRPNPRDACSRMKRWCARASCSARTGSG